MDVATMHANLEGVASRMTSTGRTHDFEGLFRDHGTGLWRAMYAYSGGRRDVADEAVAEAFARAIAHRQGIRDPLAWIYRTAFRIAADEMRRVGVRPPGSDDTIDAPEPSGLMGALRKLSPNQRAALVLRFDEGLSVEEVARRMGIVAPTVRVHIHRGRKRLRELLGAQESRMTERWLRDLRSLHTVVPSDDLWARVEEGPHGTRARIPNLQRVIAGGVAFTVFVSAAVLAWNAFRPITQEALPPAGAPQAILAFNESDPQAPQLSMTVGGGTFSATLGTHAWTFDGGSGSADAVTPAFTEGDVVRVSRGTPLFVVNAPPDVSMSAFEGLTPNVGSPISLDLSAPGADLDLPAGRYLVVVDARWDDAEAEFWLPIEIVAPDLGFPSTTGALVRDGIAVAYPIGWTVASQTLTPSLSDPREVLALGTYPLRPGGSNCAQYPVNAIEDLGPTDALIWLAERNQVSAGTPIRPPDLETWMNASPVDDSVACLSSPKDFVHRYGEFSDAGRVFDLYVAYGVSVTPETLSQLWGVVNGMRIAPKNGG